PPPGARWLRFRAGVPLVRFRIVAAPAAPAAPLPPPHRAAHGRGSRRAAAAAEVAGRPQTAAELEKGPYPSPWISRTVLLRAREFVSTRRSRTPPLHLSYHTNRTTEPGITRAPLRRAPPGAEISGSNF